MAAGRKSREEMAKQRELPTGFAEKAVVVGRAELAVGLKSDAGCLFRRRDKLRLSAPERHATRAGWRATPTPDHKDYTTHSSRYGWLAALRSCMNTLPRLDALGARDLFAADAAVKVEAESRAATKEQKQCVRLTSLQQLVVLCQNYLV